MFPSIGIPQSNEFLKQENVKFGARTGKMVVVYSVIKVKDTCESDDKGFGNTELMGMIKSVVGDSISSSPRTY